MPNCPGAGTVFLILSGLATGASWLCYFRALGLGDAARVAPLDKLSVVLVAVFGVAFLGERLSGPNWVGVGLIAAGAVLVAYGGEHAYRRHRPPARGDGRPAEPAPPSSMRRRCIPGPCGRDALCGRRQLRRSVPSPATRRRAACSTRPGHRGAGPRCRAAPAPAGARPQGVRLLPPDPGGGGVPPPGPGTPRTRGCARPSLTRTSTSATCSASATSPSARPFPRLDRRPHPGAHAPTGAELDMGTPFDHFGPPAPPPASPERSARSRARESRHELRGRDAAAEAFTPMHEEWWHFTLAAEPYPNTALRRAGALTPWPSSGQVRAKAEPSRREDNGFSPNMESIQIKTRRYCLQMRFVLLPIFACTLDYMPSSRHLWPQGEIAGLTAAAAQSLADPERWRSTWQGHWGKRDPRMEAARVVGRILPRPALAPSRRLHRLRRGRPRPSPRASAGETGHERRARAGARPGPTRTSGIRRPWSRR